MTPTQILADVLGSECGELAALSGPSIAPEIAAHMPATVTIASASPEFAAKVQAAITRPYFRAYTNSDIIGVELAGATKNVIAIAAGMIDGMKLGDNAKAALLARGLAEITRLGVKAGAKTETFAGLSGVGDLVTTCISPIGRNRSFGQAIGEGQTVEQALGATQSVVEGVATTKSVVALADKLGVEMPITQAIYDVLFRGVDVRSAIKGLMGRPLKSEGKA
jgi:glycerol-3-phosphate dehydrogenase (NAD(P)+)